MLWSWERTITQLGETTDTNGGIWRCKWSMHFRVQGCHAWDVIETQLERLLVFHACVWIDDDVCHCFAPINKFLIWTSVPRTLRCVFLRLKAPSSWCVSVCVYLSNPCICAPDCHEGLVSWSCVRIVFYWVILVIGTGWFWEPGALKWGS